MKLGNIELFKKATDGGKGSGVTGYWLIEWKKVFSIVLLKFEPSYRENFHNHAFNALTWWIWGRCTEICRVAGKEIKLKWRPSLFPKYTPRSNMHKIIPNKVVWALSIRGPWQKEWKEWSPSLQREITLTKGRVVVDIDKERV